MKTFTPLIAGVALIAASAVVNATEVQPTPVFVPFSPFTMTDTQQEFFARHQKMIAEQQRVFAEQQAANAREIMEAQRRFAEQMTVAPMAPVPFRRPVLPAAPVAIPEMPEVTAPFELSEPPAAPTVASLHPQSRRTEMRKYIEKRREAMRKLIQQQRDAALQERDKYLLQMTRVHPEV